MKPKRTKKIAEEPSLAEVKKKAVAEQRRMLKAAIKKLERQLNEVEAGATSTADSTAKLSKEEKEILDQI